MVSVYLLPGKDERCDYKRHNVQSPNTEAEKQTSPPKTTVQIVGNHYWPCEKHEILKLKW